MSQRHWKVKPPLEGFSDRINVGPGRSEDSALWLGSLAESVQGKLPQVWLSTAKEQVTAIVGKRGSGKSFTLGVIAEGLVSNRILGKWKDPRAVLLFDPLDVYWTTRFPVQPSENDEVHRHFTMAERAGAVTEPLDVHAWIPGTQNRRESDPEWFETLTLPVPELGLDEWSLLLDSNLFSEPIGQALVDSLSFTRDHGFHRNSQYFPVKAAFSLVDLADATTCDEMTTTYHAESLRALRQRLLALDSTGLFSAHGANVKELLAPARITVVLLQRLPQQYRTVIVAVLMRMLTSVRSATAFAEKRLALDPDLTPEIRETLRRAIEDGVPKTHVILDEAQSFLAPGSPGGARELFIKLVKEGRNIGLSAVLATQQPSALDRQVLSQVETFVAHQLVTEQDIRAVLDNLKSELPESVLYGAQELEFSALLRQLSSGSCFVSAADMNSTPRRGFLLHVRPRATVHGGIEL